MQKTIIVLIVLLSGIAGYLVYDWHAKIKRQVTQPGITLYSWTDEEGNKHFTDKDPPKGAINIQKSVGYKYVDPPLIVTIKDKTIEIYRSIQAKIFRHGDKEKREGKKK